MTTIIREQNNILVELDASNRYWITRKIDRVTRTAITFIDAMRIADKLAIPDYLGYEVEAFDLHQAL